LKRFLGVATVLAVAAPIMLLAAPAHADTIAAGGSDTTQDVMQAILPGLGAVNVKHKHNQTTQLDVAADSFCNEVVYKGQADSIPNGTSTADGTSPTTWIVQPPSGSGEGRTALTNSVAKTYPLTKPDSTTYYTGVASSTGGCIDIARESSKGSSPIENYAFALDVVGAASTSLNAPSSLTLQQLRDIWNCNYNNWADVGGANAPIQRILPAFGSGTRQYFVNNLMNIPNSGSGENGSTAGWTPPDAGTNPITSAAVACPHTISAGTDITGPEENKGSEFLKAAFRGQYQNYIFPYSEGKWVYQANNSTNPTLDTRSGVRPIALSNPAGNSGAMASTPAAFAVRWLGSSWSLNDATVLDGATSTRSVAGVSAAAQFSTTLTVPSALFTQSDVGLTIRGNSFINDGTVITAVAGDGMSVTIGTPTKAASVCGCTYPQTATIVVGYSIVSEKNPNVPPATTDSVNPEYGGVRYVYNGLLPTSPSYTLARDSFVGFNNTTGGAKSPLCDGSKSGAIAANGFQPLPLLRPSLVSGIDSPVSCRFVP
jgi:ABC-type phosphate transport system substrate-binding protein